MKNKLILTSVLAVSMIILFSSCNKDDSEPRNPLNGKTTAVFNSVVTYGTMTDQDGNVYKTVTIGNQVWMAENLRTTIYNDGTLIPNVTDYEKWSNLVTVAYCNYNNTSNIDTIATYGRLYNWYAVKTGKLAPKGWHVANFADWTILTDFWGGVFVAGNKLKELDTTHWAAYDTRATNESGFTALPGGWRYYGGHFDDVGYNGFWWSAPGYNDNIAWFFGMFYYNSYVNSNSNNPINGLSVRCVRD